MNYLEILQIIFIINIKKIVFLVYLSKILYIIIYFINKFKITNYFAMFAQLNRIYF